LEEPFYTRLEKQGGLGFTKAMGDIIPIFICECCTVRKVLGRELEMNIFDSGLLALERMRLIDMVHNWAPKTIAQYKGKLKRVKEFGLKYRCPILQTPTLVEPPTSAAIALMWSQQHYSLQVRQRERFEITADDDNGRVSFESIRGIRSAAALHESWILLVENPGRVVHDGSDRPIAVENCRVTDDISYRFMSTGMSRRLGIKPKQAKPLLDRHIRWIDCHFDVLYWKAINRGDFFSAQEIATAATCNLTLWLGWLRSSENFGLQWNGIDMVLPSNSNARDLPTGVGAVLLRLLEQTKSTRTHAADMAIAFQTVSGLSLGKWLFRLRQQTDHNSMDPESWASDGRYLFCHQNGRRWTSTYYRRTYLIPLLQQQRSEGDVYLQQFANLNDAMWSLHCYRTGARSHVSVVRPLCFRKAALDEVNEHGRWRTKKSNESMAERYRQWTLRDRLMLTYLCM
jgi:hypothetical protein